MKTLSFPLIESLVRGDSCALASGVLRFCCDLPILRCRPGSVHHFTARCEWVLANRGGEAALAPEPGPRAGASLSLLRRLQPKPSWPRPNDVPWSRGFLSVPPSCFCSRSCCDGKTQAAVFHCNKISREPLHCVVTPVNRVAPGLAADDVTRLAVALAYKPEADVAKGALPESEARDLYSLYSSRHGRAREGGTARSELTILQEEMLRRLAKYVGLL
jgi:hypothetical protein